MSVPQHTWHEVLQDKWWIAPLSFAVSLVVTPIVRYFAYKKGFVDRPDDLLKPHARPVAYLGGVAMCIGLLAGLVGYLSVMPHLEAEWDGLVSDMARGHFYSLLMNPLWNMLWIGLACVLITVVGLVDDLRGIRPSQKVLGQLAAASLLLVGGVATRVATVFLSPLGLPATPWLLFAVSAAMCFVIVIACCNATNLLDGLDGLCGGVSAIIGVGFLALTVWLAMWGIVASEMDGLRVALCLAMVGAILGFLPYNTHPASIFMGDAGSMFLGFLVATIMILFCQEGHPRWLLASLVVFAVPILDTALAVVRRILAGRSIFAGDRSHLYDQLVDRGMRLRRVVLLFYVVSVIAAVVGVLAAIYLPGREALLLHSLLFVAVWAVFHKLGVIRERPGRPQEPAEGTDRYAGLQPAPTSQNEIQAAAAAALSILFTSVGRRVSLLQEFRRAAEEMGVHLEIHAVDCQAMAPALQTADKTAIVPSVNSDAYVGSLLAYCRSHAIHAVFPLIDTELRVLAEAADRFAAIGTRTVISTPQVIRITSDKVQTNDFLMAHEFLTPQILGPEEVKSPTFPVFMKPRGGSSSLGARRVTTPEELDYYRKSCPDDVVQEFIEGVEYTVDVFADFDGSPLCAVPRRRHEVRAGEVSKSQTVRHRRIMEESCRLVRELGGCRGMVTIQCFLTRDDRIVFIEINPRFGGGVPLSIRAGADSPKWVLELLLGRRPSATMDAWTDQLFMLRYDEGIFVLRDLPRE